MATVPFTIRRHALGLPEGSIRATHTLLIVSLFCAILLVDTERVRPMPPYLVYLLFLVLGHYFAHRSGARAQAGYHPLYLPRGSVRFLVAVGLSATLAWCLYNNSVKLQDQFEASLEALKEEPLLPVFILGSFFLGVLVRVIVGSENPPFFMQDMEAWVSLISILGLAVAMVIHLIIQPSVEETLSMPLGEAILASIISFYFGARS